VSLPKKTVPVDRAANLLVKIKFETTTREWDCCQELFTPLGDGVVVVDYY
jgi:hypothetical protein